MVNLKRIDNSDILVRDLRKTIEFYHDTLGLPFFLPYEPEEGWAAIDAGNLTFYIIETQAGEHAPRRSVVNAESPPGLDSFAFEVDDLDASIAALDGKVEWAGPVTRSDHPLAWYRYRGMYDPEGNLLYITEPHIGPNPAAGRGLTIGQP